MSSQQPQRDSANEVPAGRRFPMWLVGVIIIIVVSLLFISQNRKRINVDFVVFNRDARIWVVILVSMLLGALLAELIRFGLRRRRTSKT